MKKAALSVAMALMLTTGACSPAESEPSAAAKAPDEVAILSTVDAFFLAMAAKDADALSAIVAPGATMIAIGYNDGGVLSPRRSSMQGFIDAVRDGSFGDQVHEAYWNPTVLQRADFAAVWAPYRIDIAGERLHCGIDVFNLSRENGKWFVDSLSFTMEPKACPELEPEGVAARPVFPE